MQLKDPNPIVPVNIPQATPMLEWGIFGTLCFLTGKRILEWTSSILGWFVSKDQSEDTLLKEMIEFQQETIRMLIERKIE